LAYDIEQTRFCAKNIYMELMNLFMQMDRNEIINNNVNRMEEESVSENKEESKEESEEEPEDNMELFRVVICGRLPSLYSKDDIIKKYGYNSKEFSNNVIRAKSYNKGNEPKKHNNELKEMINKYKNMKLVEFKEFIKIHI
jgi:hypothetical protein